MPVANALQTTIPAPYAASFTDGEIALAVASPSSSTPARSVYQLSRWFDFDGGIYTIKCVAKDSAQWYVGPTRDNARFVLSQTIQQGVITTSVHLPAGRQRITIILANVQASSDNTYVALKISKNGRTVYTSAASGWVFDTTAIADNDLPSIGDPRLGLRVFTLRPNWASEVIERVTFNTEILPSETDIEQRRALRRMPRRSFEATFLRTKRDRSRLQSFLTGIGQDKFLVPLWHEQWRLTEAFALSVEFPSGTATAREFQPGTLALLSNNDASVYEIVQVDAVNALTDQVTFSRLQTPQSWPVGTRLTPLRVAMISDATAMDNPTDRVGTSTLRFDLIEMYDHVEPSWRYCVPLWQFPLNWSQPVALNISRLSYSIDNETSVPEAVSPGERTRIVTRAGVLLRGRSNVYAFRQFMASTRGRQVSFWFPSTLSDLQPAADISGLYFDVEKAGIGEYVKTPQEIHRTVMVRFKGDERPPIFRFVSAIETLTSVERVFVTIALPAIQKEAIEEISFVHPVRFEQDAFELRHLVNDSAAVSTSVVVRSTEVGDLPPIECIVTSQPYPVENIESLNVGMTVAAVFEAGFFWPPEGVNASMTFTEVSLVNQLAIYDDWAPEAMNVAMTATEVTLTEIDNDIVAYDNYAPEAVDAAMAPTNISLVNQLLSYNNYAPEAVNVSFTFSAGTLT